MTGIPVGTMGVMQQWHRQKCYTHVVDMSLLLSQGGAAWRGGVSQWEGLAHGGSQPGGGGVPISEDGIPLSREYVTGALGLHADLAYILVE